MANPPYNDFDTSMMLTNCISASDTSTPTLSFRTYYREDYAPKHEIVETKKEKVDRVSKEKMLASWKIYDQKTPNVIKIKQMCKPRHRISNGAFRGLR